MIFCSHSTFEANRQSIGGARRQTGRHMGQDVQCLAP